MQNERGVALVITLLAISFLSALGLGLVLSSSIARMADTNHEDAAMLLNVAESALELTARDLSVVANWNLVVSGGVVSSLTDGPAGPRVLPDGSTIELARLTNELTCGRVTTCSDAQRTASNLDRPWGPPNPRWALFRHGLVPGITTPRHRIPPYVIVWLGDDASERDNDPSVDGGGPEGDGRNVLRARAEAFGSNGGRRAVEAELVRVCQGNPPDEVCVPGTHLRAWRATAAAP